MLRMIGPFNGVVRLPAGAQILPARQRFLVQDLLGGLDLVQDLAFDFFQFGRHRRIPLDVVDVRFGVKLR